MEKNIVRLTESDLHEMIRKTIKNVLREGAYDYPDGIDFLILMYENDRECMTVYEDIVRMVLKKSKTEELSLERLVNSSVMKKFQQMVFRKFKDEQISHDGTLSPTAPYDFRKFVSERILDNIKDQCYGYTLDEETQFMDDDDISAQYGDMRITGIDIHPLRYSDGWGGSISVEFPNADGVDFDESMVNGFISYDNEGERIAFDSWMPDEQTNKAIDAIRKEIAKRNNGI